MTSEPAENFAWAVELWLIMNHNRESGTGIMKDLIDVIYPSEHERQSIHSHPHTLISTTIYSQNCTLLFHSFVTTSIKSSGIQKTMNGLLIDSKENQEIILINKQAENGLQSRSGWHGLSWTVMDCHDGLS